MLDNNKSNEDIKFEGMEIVLKRLDKELIEEKSLLQQVGDFMNMEIQLSVKHFLFACLLLVCVLGVRVEKTTIPSTAYSITVVDQGGCYEIY